MPGDGSVEIIVKLRDLVSKQIKGIRAGFKRLGSGLRDLKGILFSLKSALIALGLGLLTKSLLAAGVATEKLNLQLKAATGGFIEARDASKYLREESNRLGLIYQDQIGIFSQVAAAAKGTALEGQAVRDVWVAVAEASSVLQLSAEDTKGAMTALTQIISKGKLSAEELRQQLGERLPGAFQIAAKAMGVTTMELDKMLANGEIMSEEFIPKFSAALRERFGPDVELAAQSWTANVNRMKNIWFEFRVEIMEGGLFNFLKAGLSIVLEEIKKFKDDGSLSDWAVETSNALIKVINFIGKLGAGVVESITFMKRAFNGFTTLVNIVLEKVFSGLSKFIDKLSAIADKLGADDIAEKLNKVSKELNFVSETAGEEVDKGITKLIGLAESQGQVWNKTIDYLDKVKKKAKELGEQSKKAISSATPVEREALPVAKLSDTELEKSRVRQLKNSTKTALAILDAAYEQGSKSLKDYYNERKNLIQEQFNAEIELYNKLADQQNKDPVKRKQYLDKVFELEQTLEQELVKLDQDRFKKQEALDKARVEKDQILNEIRSRNAYDYTENIKILNEKELADLKLKHEEEIQAIKDLKLEEIETKEALDELYRQQKIEKDKVLLEQERKIQEKRLEMLSSAAGNFKSVFTDLYEGLGEKQKEFFYLAKAAAMAEAIINNAQAVTKAYAQGGIYGLVSAAAIAAKGAIEIAKIASQQLAEGGLVLGNSPGPKSDDKLIAATSGEYMMQTKAVKKYGVGFMDLVNKGLLNLKSGISNYSMPARKVGFADGGLIGPNAGVGGASMLGESSRQNNEVTIVNFTDPTELEKFLSTDAGQRAVMNVISNNGSQAKRIIQRG